MALQTRHIFFDGGCGFCRNAARWLRRLDWLGKTVHWDIAHQWPIIHEKFPQLDLDACVRDMHVVTEDDRTYRGFDAYRSLAWVLPAMWLILPLLYLPPIRWIGWKIYRHVADNRHSCAYNARQ
jgi:predicted DCC family thiol-disulfide oxidoreductase YuxK